MCGIFALINNNNLLGTHHVKTYFKRGALRGPEHMAFKVLDEKTTLGFHRLAINGLDETSNQPIVVNGINVICNGEIYNYKELYKSLGVTPKTGSDCEVIIHMYMKYGIQYTLDQLDGVFAFVLVDKNKMFIARDPYGVRPLYHLQAQYNNNCHVECFSSTLSTIDGITRNVSENKEKIVQFEPGTYAYYKKDDYQYWCLKEMRKYTTIGLKTICMPKDEKTALTLINNGLTEAVRKRVDNTERPVACLLSGGLDSSLIAALVSKFYKGTLETYSIGLKDAEDLKYAKIVSNFIGSKHTEIIVSEEDFFNAIEVVIKNIESYDTTSVRASVGNYLIGKYISENSEAKVIFNGDGSDELAGGYMYFHAAPSSIEFDYECKRLLGQIHYYDVLRSDRSISSHGLEPRTPFLDRGFVQTYLSIDPELRCHTGKNCEKYLLRKAFDSKDNPLLPAEVLWRKKEAFSDGVSNLNRSWYSIIDENISKRYGKQYDNIYTGNHAPIHNTPKTREQKYYRYIFNHYYSQPELIPKFWMPRFVDATDSSARTLKVYDTQSVSSN